MIVADASVVVSALLGDGLARRHLARDAVHVPHLADAEVASALRHLDRRSVIASDTATEALGVWQRLGVIRHATVAHLPRVWELRGNLSAYDATYVALAEALGAPLLTADRRLAGSPGPVCEIVVVPG